ncbi:MAG: metal ABC transporter substrate-binding protein [Cyanobacteriota bacterium]|nr:metal ABC transporter substrate-binding protein [Cyanobacteriota bacterium]
MTQPTPWLLATSIVLTLGLIGCSSPTNTAAPTNPAADQNRHVVGTSVPIPGKKRVVTTFTILADMARNVAGDKLEVESVVRIGAEIHGYEPTPSDIAKASDADLVLYNGMNLERWFESFYNNLEDVPSVQLTEGIQTIPIAEGPYENKPNPHAWMSPRNALIYVENIRKAFVELDPDNADTYNANAAAYSQQLETIDRDLQADLERLSPQQRYLVSCEGAFSYLARDYDLEEIYLWPINAEQQSTPKQIQKAIATVKKNRVPTVFCESTVSSDGQKQVAKEAGARFGGNLYVDSLSTEDGPVPTFLELLEYDARTIANGLLAGSNTNKP